jgi:uncharacterized membrane protein (UPF0127 family)
MKIPNFLALFVGLSWLLAAVVPNQAQTAAPSPVRAQAPSAVTLHIGKATLNAEIAATDAQREQGLMYREKLADNDGMIFIMPGIAPATFWMKNTLIPLSVAFLDRNGIILEIHDMKPLDESITRSESNQVAYALETNVHWFALNGIKPGDKIAPAPSTFSLPPTP